MKQKNKSAQLQIGETIFILIIFFILLFIGLIFYSKVEMNSIANTKQLDAEREILKSALEIIYLPELSCMDLSNELSEGCFDLYKLEAFTDLTQDPNYERTMRLEYYDLFADSKVTINVTFPKDSGISEFVIYNRLVENVSIKKTFIPVIVKDPSNEQNYFGYLKIESSKK